MTTRQWNYLPLPPPPRLLPPLLLLPPEEREGGDTDVPRELLPELGLTVDGRGAGAGLVVLVGLVVFVGRLVDDGRVLCPAGLPVVPDGRTFCPAGLRVVPDGCTLCPAGRRTPPVLRVPRVVVPVGLTVLRAPPLTSDDARLPTAARVAIRPLASRARVPSAFRAVERAVRTLIRSLEAERGALVRLSIIAYPG